MKTPLPLALVFLVGAVLGAAVATMAGTALASDGPLAGRVLTADAQVVKVAPSGKARITELAQGRQAFLGILELDAGAAVPQHQDPTEEYIHVLSGGGTMTIDGQVMTVKTGDTVYMPAFATVSYANGPEPLRVVQVFAGPGPAKKYATWAPR